MKRLFSLILMFSIGLSLVFSQEEPKVDSLIRSYYQEGKPGVAVTIVRDSKTIYNHEVGLANIEYNIPISDSTSFNIASVSKQFTAYLALKLEQEGKLNMDNDVRNYLPELIHLPYKITLDQLANHTHGLPNVSELSNIKGFGLADRMWHRDVVNIALNIKTFNFKPGDQYQYNNTGFVLLAEIIERVCKMPFQEVLQTYIFNPLEMDASLAVPSPDIIVKNRAESYAFRNGDYTRNNANNMSNGDGGIRTTIKDLAKWITFFQKTLSEPNSPFSMMIENSYLNNGKPIPYGLGLETKMYKGLYAVFHGGGDAGYRAYTLHIPEYNISVVVLGNGNDYWPLAIAYEIIDIYLSDHQTQVPKPQKMDYKTQELLSFEGVYQFCPGNYYKFTAESDTLYMEVIGSPDKFALPTLGDYSFGFPFYPESKFIFEKGRVDFKIADFKYPCVKVEPVLKTYTIDELIKFKGIYRNAELNTAYEILIENDKLIARHPINYDIALQGLENDSFFSSYGFFGKLSFKVYDSQEVTGFNLSGQNLKDLKFYKILE